MAHVYVLKGNSRSARRYASDEELSGGWTGFLYLVIFLSFTLILIWAGSILFSDNPGRGILPPSPASYGITMQSPIPQPISHHAIIPAQQLGFLSGRRSRVSGERLIVQFPVHRPE